MTLTGILIVIGVVMIIGIVANSLERGSSIKDIVSLASRVPGIFVSHQATQRRDMWEFIVIRQTVSAMGSAGALNLKHLPSSITASVHPSLYDEIQARLGGAGWELASRQERGRTLLGAYTLETTFRRHL